ncbi:amidohydrolase family protein [Streptomyces sp. SCPE 10]|uniref:amidohydrolase family protein n=1 Tax=Streptomyces sp. SCPE 10 TaxID=3449273 RepID=UPI003F7FAC97
MQYSNSGAAGGLPSGVHAPVREDWLALVDEPLALPDIPIIDAHHHLWDRPNHTYLAEEYLQDLAAVPTVMATVYVQCRSSYRTDGPEELKPAGEVRFARRIAEDIRRTHPSAPDVCRAVVAGADLTLGRRLGGVLDVMQDEAKGRLRGIRNQTAWHVDPRVSSSPFRPSADRLIDPEFQAGVRTLAQHDLSVDVWAYHTQLSQVRELARTCPYTTIVVDHMGGPLGIGPYAHARGDVLTEWDREMTELARFPNVHLKLSGAGLRVLGFRFDERSAPPSSERLASAMTPLIETCLRRFGPERCMFASNFPVDKGMFGYRVLWNAFARTVADLSPAEQARLFHGTAESVYRIGLSTSTAALRPSQEEPHDQHA